jgi:hypothetical protein
MMHKFCGVFLGNHRHFFADTGLSHAAQSFLALGLFIGAAFTTTQIVHKTPALVKKTSSAKWKSAREGPVGNPISLQ